MDTRGRARTTGVEPRFTVMRLLLAVLGGTAFAVMAWTEARFGVPERPARNSSSTLDEDSVNNTVSFAAADRRATEGRAILRGGEPLSPAGAALTRRRQTIGDLPAAGESPSHLDESTWQEASATDGAYATRSAAEGREQTAAQQPRGPPG